MAKVTKTYCDLCGTEHTKHENSHWTEQWGHITLDFKDMSAIQAKYEYTDCCVSCARVLNETVKEAIKVIKEKAATNKVLYGK